MLTDPTDSPLQLGGFAIGLFETNTDLASDENFTIAKDWIETCTTKHKECPSNDEPPLPTRVIDVGENGHGDCRVLINRSNIEAHYVALSHCWGGPIDCVLKTEELQEFQQRLPWDRLTANFQDAITVTRKLGVRYLWIDSFCIIQDDDDDWAQESANMADIYRNSLFTIAAMSSPESEHGFIRNIADPPTFLDQTIEIPLSKNDRRTVTVSLFRQPESYERESFNTLSLRAPLSKRGWCLQESVLSSRILFYGRDRIYWKCFRGYQSADGMHPGRQFSDVDLYPGLLPVLFSGVSRPDALPRPDLDMAAVLQDYYWLVNSFTQRELTHGSDKLPAFSGLAKPIHLALGGQYLAGLLSVYIRSGLLWKRETGWTDHSDPYEYRAPSWSWVEANDSVTFAHETIEFLDDTSAFELLGSFIELKHKENPYGEVTSGYLLVRGRVAEIWRTREKINTATIEQMEYLGSAHWDEPMIRGERQNGLSTANIIVEFTEEDEGGTYRLAEMTDLEKLERLMHEYGLGEPKYVPPKRYMALLIHQGLISENDEEPEASCLILEQVGCEEVRIYRRVGFLRLLTDFLVVDPQTWTQESLKII